MLSETRIHFRRVHVGQTLWGLGLLAGGLLSFPAESLGQRGPAPVVVSNVVEADVAIGQSFVGTVVPVRRAAVGSAVDGRVADFPIHEGDFVRKGDALTQLLTATISLEVEAAERELELRQYEFDELKNGSRKEEIEQSEAIMQAAQATKDYQEKRLARIRELFTRNVVNEEEMQLALSNKIQAEQDHLAAVASHELMVQGPREERIKQAQAQVGIQTATVERLKDMLGKHTMRAPFDGYIAAEHTQLGQWVQRGELVAEVIALDQVDVLTYVPEQSIRFIAVGQTVTVEIPALPDHLFTGEVALIIPQADLQARTFPVKVRITNTIDEQGPLIKAGMMARSTMPTGQPQKSLLVSKDAVVLGLGQRMVYVVSPAASSSEPATVRAVPVMTGTSFGQNIVVRGELKAGDQVVVRGNDRIRPNQQVTISRVIEVAADGQTLENGTLNP